MRHLIVNDSIKFKNNLLRNIILLPVSAVLFYIITIVVDSYIIGPLVGESTNQNTIVSIINGGGALPMFIAVVICAPLVEELIYRKAIFELFRNRSIIFCYIISTILFVLPHMISTNVIISKWVLLCVPYVVSAILLSFIYHISGENFYASWFVHLINNLLAFLIIFMMM